MPIHQLWKDSDWIDAKRGDFLTFSETKALIQQESIPFAIASMMSPIYWSSQIKRFNDWEDLSPHFLDGTREEWVTDKHHFYVASLWYSDSQDYLLFEHHH